MKGNILFYAYHGGMFEWFITEATQSRFVHVEVALDDQWAIGALGSGVSKHPLVATPYQWSFAEHMKDQSLLANAEEWLVKQVGKQYGIDDIITAGLQSVMHGLVYLGQQDHYDCSDLATRFLIEAGAVEFLGDLAQEPHTVTPAMLAKQLGIV